MLRGQLPPSHFKQKHMWLVAVPPNKDRTPWGDSSDLRKPWVLLGTGRDGDTLRAGE